MGLFELLPWMKPGRRREVDNDTESVRAIKAELQDLDPDRARFVACYAYVLGRVAYADRDVSEAERRVMTRILQKVGHLGPDRARLITDIAANQSELFGETEGYVVTRELREITTKDQRREVLSCLLAVAAADEIITGDEEATIRQMASELGFSHREYIDARMPFSDKRAVMKDLRSDS